MADSTLDVLLAALDHATTAERDESGRLTPEAADEVQQLVDYAASLAPEGAEDFCDHGVNEGKPGPCPGEGADESPEAKPAATGRLARVKAKISGLIRKRYQKLSARYGKRGAMAVMAGMALLTPNPIPGTSLIPVAIAEGIRGLGKLLKHDEFDEEVDAEALATELRLLWHDLHAEAGERAPDLSEEEAIAAIEQAQVQEGAEDFADEDVDTSAELIADVLYGIYGHDALSLLQGKPASFAERSWSSEHHPRGKDGRFIAKGSSEAGHAAHKAVQAALRGDAQPHTAESLLGHLSILNVSQLRELHRQHSIKAPGRLRAHLVDAINARLAGQHSPAPEKKKAKAEAARKAEGEKREKEQREAESRRVTNRKEPPTAGKPASGNGKPVGKPEEIESLRRYSGGSAFRINQALWTGVPIPESLQKADKDIQSIFSQTPPLEKPRTVYRGANVGRAAVESIIASLKKAQDGGQAWGTPAYLSTTSIESDVKDSPISFKILASHGLDMESISSSPEEKELLLNRGASFRVKSIQKRPDGGWNVEMEQVHD